MLVSSLISDMSVLELSNISMMDDNNVIRPKMLVAFINALNEGMHEIYSSLCVMQKDLLLEPVEGMYTYELSSKFAISNSGNGEPHHYILDHTDPFKDDMIRILHVQGPDSLPLALNDENVFYSLYTPSPLVLQIPTPSMYQTVGITYQAYPTKVVSQTEDIEVPFAIIRPLKGYIAYKLFSAMNTVESNQKAQEHLSLFDTTINKFMSEDILSSSQINSTNKFNRRGWS